MCTCSREHNITPPEFLLAAYKIDSLSPTAHSNLSHGESCLNSQSPYAKLRKPGIWNFFSFLLLREPSFQSHCCCSHCLLAPAAEDNLLITFATHTLMYHLSLIISPHCMFFHSRQLFRLFCLVLPALSAHTNKLKKLAMQNSARCFETLIAASSRQFPFFFPSQICLSFTVSYGIMQCKKVHRCTVSTAFIFHCYRPFGSKNSEDASSQFLTCWQFYRCSPGPQNSTTFSRCFHLAPHEVHLIIFFHNVLSKTHLSRTAALQG